MMTNEKFLNARKHLNTVELFTFIRVAVNGNGLVYQEICWGCNQRWRVKKLRMHSLHSLRHCHVQWFYSYEFSSDWGRRWLCTLGDWLLTRMERTLWYLLLLPKTGRAKSSLIDDLAKLFHLCALRSCLAYVCLTRLYFDDDNANTGNAD